MKLDHVHIHVRDRKAAAEWMHKVFGMTQEAQFSHWARVQGGPLFLHTRDGHHGVALFESDQANSGDHTVAFKASGREFLDFLDRLPDLELQDQKGGAVTRDDAVDHTGAWSIYFADNDGNRYELTTYDDSVVAKVLAPI